MDPAVHAAAQHDAGTITRFSIRDDLPSTLDGAVVELQVKDGIVTGEVRIPGPAVP